MSMSPDAQLDALLAIRKIEKPSLQALTEQAELLTTTTPNDTLKSLLRQVWFAGLDELDQHDLLKIIKQKTGKDIATLRAILKKLKKSAGADTTRGDLGESIVERALNDHWSQGAHILYAQDGRFWVYSGTHWAPRDDVQIQATLLATLRTLALPDEASHASLLSQALTLLRAHTARTDDPLRFLADPLPAINCANGTLHLFPDGRLQLRPHAHTDYLTSCLPFAFDPEATAPRYKQAVLEIFSQDQALADHWHEFVGYAIQPVRDLPSWWLLRGGGENGKSKLMETVSRLVGPDAVASVRVGSLDRQFGLGPLLGRLLMVDDDVESHTKLPDGLLKQISERKRVSVELKGKTPFDATLTVVPVLLANGYPSTSDLSHGMLRRAQVIPFNRDFRGAQADRTLFPAIWAGEMPGVLNLALAGLHRLRSRGGFAPPPAALQALEVWLNAANPFKAFLDECVELLPVHAHGQAIPLTLLYQTLQIWAKEAGVNHVIQRNTLKRNLEALGLEVGRSGDHGAHLKSAVWTPAGADLKARAEAIAATTRQRELGQGYQKGMF